jgi:hypothetical protein
VAQLDIIANFVGDLAAIIRQHGEEQASRKGGGGSAAAARPADE